MKNRIIIVSILISKIAFGQPNPQERYPERIKAITEQLKTDSLNYELIWERLEMKVNLAGRLINSDDIFSMND
jgi:pantothenate synthetase